MNRPGEATTELSDPLFARALNVVLAHEGGFTDDPDDPGGATNFGVSLRFARSLGDLDGDGRLDLDLDYDGDVDVDDVRELTRADAAAIYRRMFWDRYGYYRLPDKVAVKTFDLAVNMGPREAHRCLQRALRAINRPVPDDGMLGPRTLLALSVVFAVGDAALLAALRSEAAGIYRMIAARRPRSAKYLEGWLNRAYA